MHYYIAALSAGAMLRYSWILSMFATLEEYVATEDYDITIRDGEYHYLLDGEYVSLQTKHVLNVPLYEPKTPLSLPANTFVNQSQPEETTYGIALANYILLIHPFGDVIPYINRTFSIKDVERQYTKLLVADKDKAKGKVTVSQKLLCKRGCILIGQLTRILVHSATHKNMVAPTGIKAYKKKLIAEYAKAGKRLDDPLVVVDFNEKLIKFDEEFMKDDPSAGIYVDGKIKYVSRLKVYMAYGSEKAWTSTKTQTMVTKSLDEGSITTPEELVAVNNTVRTASFSRGTEIILGGVTATLVTRISAHLTVKKGDCKSTETLDFVVREGEHKKYIGRTILTPKPLLITEDNASTISGKPVRLRSVTTCKYDVLCQVCAGKAMSARPNGLGLFAFGVSSKIVKSSLASFHSSKLSATTLNIDDIA